MLLVAGIFRRGVWFRSVKKTNSLVSRHMLKIYHNKLGYKGFSYSAPCTTAVKYIDGFMPGAAVPEPLLNRQYEKRRVAEYQV